MKNFILSLLAFGAFGSLSAQSIQVTTDVPVPAMSLIDLNITHDFLGFHVKNITGLSIDVRVNRLVNDIPAGHDTYFCWEYCYDPSVSLSGGATAGGLAIAPDSTADNFTFHIDANGIEGCGHAIVHFFNKKNANDFVEYVFDYCTPNAVGIADEVNAANVLSAPMPNPSSQVAIVRIDLPRNTDNTYLAVRDLAGKEISRFAVNQSKTSISIPTSQYSAGLYYVSLVAEGNVLATQKLIVEN